MKLVLPHLSENDGAHVLADPVALEDQQVAHNLLKWDDSNVDQANDFVRSELELIIADNVDKQLI